AVAAVRAAERLELLPVHRRAAVPAVARLHRDGDVVGELGHFSIASWVALAATCHEGGPARGPPSTYALVSLVADLVRPRRARGPRAAHPPDRARPADEREQGVVPATADARAGVEVGAALAHDDLARVDLLTAESLHAQPLGGRVTAVAAGRRALLVCHRQLF